jgi:HopA1 effector protein family
VVVYLVPGGGCNSREQLITRVPQLIDTFREALSLQGALPQALVRGVPPMVQEVYDGIGWAEQPPQAFSGGRSFGEYRSLAIAEALLNAQSEQAFYSRVLETFGEHRISIHQPHLNVS